MLSGIYWFGALELPPFATSCMLHVKFPCTHRQRLNIARIYSFLRMSTIKRHAGIFLIACMSLGT